MLLEHFDLKGYIFNKEHMEHLVECLHSNQSHTLSNCSFDLEATDVFRFFMLMSETMSSTRVFGNFFGDCDRSNGDGIDGAILVSMLTMTNENQGTGSSIASRLQVLELGNNFAG